MADRPRPGSETAYQHEAIDRAIDGRLNAEDVIIHKLLAWRPRDRDDIASILRSDTTIDTEHIERWAEAWEVTDRWQAARRDLS